MASADFDWKRCFDQISLNLVLYARQLTPSPADAEDVVQMAFVRWWRRFPDGDKDNIPLLYAAVRTIALDLRRSDTRRAKREAASEIAIDGENTETACPDPAAPAPGRAAATCRGRCAGRGPPAHRRRRPERFALASHQRRPASARRAPEIRRIGG